MNMIDCQIVSSGNTYIHMTEKVKTLFICISLFFIVQRGCDIFVKVLKSSDPPDLLKII